MRNPDDSTTIQDVTVLYDFALQQMAAESYLEGIDIQVERDVKSRLMLGTNRPGYFANFPDPNFNGGLPGFTRMTNVQAEEFLSRFEIRHQWSDNPSTGEFPGSRPIPEGDPQFPQLNEDILANTGLSATLIYSREDGSYTLSIRSTEFRDWEHGGDGERDTSGADSAITKMGFALAQMNALEKYYQWLKDNAYLPDKAVLNVTGYSLGGSLATTFTEMHSHDTDIDFGKTVTFNGAGHGLWDSAAGSLSDMVAYFDDQLKSPSVIQVEDLDLASLAYGFLLGGDTPFALQQKAVARGGVSFDGKSLYDDPRYKWAVYAVAVKFKTLPSIVNQGTAADDKITQLYGYETISNLNVVANSQNHGPTVAVPIEDQPLVQGGPLGGMFGSSGDFGTGHSIDHIADSLALQRAIQELDSGWSLERMQEYLPDATNKVPVNVDYSVLLEPLLPGSLIHYPDAFSSLFAGDYESDALENMLDSIRYTILGPGIQATKFYPGFDGFGDIGSRNDFYNNIEQLANDDGFKLLNGRVTMEVSGAALGSTAGRSFSSLISLINLSPFRINAVSGSEELVDEVIAINWAKEYEDWLADRSLTQPEHFTELWTKDRASFLAWKMEDNRRNVQPDTENVITLSDQLGRDSWMFIDARSKLTIRTAVPIVGKFLPPAHVAYFGDFGDSAYIGSEDSDHLYGGAGNDTLIGGDGDDHLEGNDDNDTLSGGMGMDVLLGQDGDDVLYGGRMEDRLEGGIGDDSYTFFMGDGVDTIYDRDGIGHIEVGGVVLGNGVKETGNSWVFKSGDSAYRYVLVTESDGSRSLKMFPPGAGTNGEATIITIEKFTNGNLGINLNDVPTPAPQPPSVIVGDVLPTLVPEANGIPEHYEFDSNGNVVGTQNGMSRPDLVQGSAVDDAISSGLGGDIIDAKGGDDRIFAGTGNDLVGGGTGKDTIYGDEGDDVIFGDGHANGRGAVVSFDNNGNIVDADPPVEGAVLQSYSIVDEDYIPDVPGAGALDNVYHGSWATYTLTGAALQSYMQSSYNPVDAILYGLSPTRFGSVTLLKAGDWLYDTPGDMELGDGDRIDGGAGNDSIYGNAGDDTLLGGTGDDYLKGGSGADTLEGGSDNDVLFGDTMLYTSFRYSTLDVAFGVFYKTSEVETYDSQFGNDWLYGGTGHDSLFGMAGSDVLFGEEGNDILVGDFIETRTIPVLRLNEDETSYTDSSTHLAEAVQYHGNDILDGGSGDDLLIGLAGNDKLWGGADNDVLMGDGTPDAVQSRYGRDMLDGGTGNDLLVGSGGNDDLYGSDGNDTLFGDETASPNNNAVTSWGNVALPGSGTATLLAQDQHGNDNLFGGKGNDELQGGGFDDYLWGGENDDLLIGDGTGVTNEGNDHLFGEEGNDELQGGGGDDILRGDEGDDILFGQNGVDTLLGGSGADELQGGEGNDTLNSGEGDDELYGQEGEDTLEGGAGMDYQSGGEGNDTYVFNLGDSQRVNNCAEVIQESGGGNTIRFGAGISVSSISLHNPPGTGDVILHYSDTDTLYLKGGMEGTISTFEFASGESLAWRDLATSLLLDSVTQLGGINGGTVVGGRSNDLLTVGSGSVVRGGAGNDRINVGGEQNTYVFHLGDGKDSVAFGAVPSSPESGNRIQFGAGITSSDLTLGLQADSQGMALQIQVGASGNDVITLLIDPATLVASSPVSAFRFADGSTLGIDNWVSPTGTGLRITQSVAVGAAWDEYRLNGQPSASFRDDDQGNTLSKTFNADGVLVGDSWVHADTSHGSDIFSNGSSSGIAYAADGSGYSTYENDGNGTISTSYFTSGGLKLNTHWTAADGSHGDDTFNVDGSHVRHEVDGDGNEKTTVYDAGNHKLSDSWINADGTTGSDTFHADGSSSGIVNYADHYRTIEIDSLGNSLSADFRQVDNARTHEEWQNVDGSHGYRDFNADGALAYSFVHGAVVDGSYAVTVIDAAGTTTVETFDVLSDRQLSETLTKTDGYSFSKTFLFNECGDLTGHSWTANDGSWGSDTLAMDGSLQGEFHNGNGSYGTIEDDGHGNSSTITFNSAGDKIHEGWQQGNGRSSDITFGPGGASSGTVHLSADSHYTFTDDGQGNSDRSYYDHDALIRTESASRTVTETGVVISKTDETGTTTRTFDLNGALVSDSTLRPDNSSISSVYAADGGYTTTIEDGQGNKLISQVNGDGATVSDAWWHADGTRGSNVYAADGGVTHTRYQSGDNGYTITATDAQGLHCSTEYYTSGNVLTMRTESGNGVQQLPGIVSYPEDFAGYQQTLSFYNPDGSLSRQLVVDGYGLAYEVSYGADGKVTVVENDPYGTAQGNDEQVISTYDPSTGEYQRSSWVAANGQTALLEQGGTLHTADGYRIERWEIFNPALDNPDGNSSSHKVLSHVSYGSTSAFIEYAFITPRRGMGEGNIIQSASSYTLAVDGQGSLVQIAGQASPNVDSLIFSAESDGRWRPIAFRVNQTSGGGYSPGYNGSDAQGHVYLMASGGYASSLDPEFILPSSNPLPNPNPPVATTPGGSPGDGLPPFATVIELGPTSWGNGISISPPARFYPNYKTYTYYAQDGGFLDSVFAQAARNLQSEADFPSQGLSLIGVSTPAAALATISRQNGTVVVADDWSNAISFSSNEKDIQWSNANGVGGSIADNQSGVIHAADGSHAVMASTGIQYYDANHNLLFATVQGQNTLVHDFHDPIGYSHTTAVGSGSGFGTAYGTRSNPDGSSVESFNDGKGNVSSIHFDTDGVMYFKSWKLADGSHGSVYYSHGSFHSSFTTVPYADGSYATTSQDATGNSSVIDYDASGAKRADSWTHADKSRGSDVFNADGSSSGSAYNLDGTYSEYTSDGQGNLDTSYRDAADNLLRHTWTYSDGEFGWEIYEAGTLASLHSDDGLGNTLDEVYDSLGNLLSSVSRYTDGTSESVTSTYEGSLKVTETWVYADGSSDAGTFSYDSEGRLAHESWLSSDGSTYVQDYAYGTDGLDDWAGTASNETYEAYAGDDVIYGKGGDDSLYGGEGDDVLNGGAGDDTLFGGPGNDSYVIDSASDAVFEAVEDGIDVVRAVVTCMLSDNVENLILKGAAAIDGTGNDLANTLMGNAAANVLSGGVGNDVLNGGAGADTLVGGSGNDTYIVDNSGDVINEYAAEGVDHVRSSVTYTLAACVENMTLTGTAAIGGTGNGIDNVLIGNSAANMLIGDAGNDVLKGGGGIDTLVGGVGDDVYVVDSATDIITELPGEGRDAILSSVSYSLAALAEVENLRLTGVEAISATGNAQANTLRGNSAANTLTGGAGNDTYLFGRGGGADTIVDSDATADNADLLRFGAGIAYDQLWFDRVGDSLEVSVIGSSDKLSITDWYLDASNHVETLRVAEGLDLQSGSVEQLVQAMAAMAPPPAGQMSLSASQHQQLDAVLAASWQAA